jgi:CrcB protein
LVRSPARALLDLRLRYALPLSEIVRHAEARGKLSMPSQAGLREFMLVFAAGGSGAALRVWFGAWLEAQQGARLESIGTLAANLFGCLLIGLCSVAIASPTGRMVVMGGFLGGFTTYSAFALFSVEFMGASKWDTLALQLGLHLAGGMLCVYLGMQLARGLGLEPSSVN